MNGQDQRPTPDADEPMGHPTEAEIRRNAERQARQDAIGRGRRQPEWMRRRDSGQLPPKDTTGAVAL